MRNLLKYDPDTGAITWLVNRMGPVKAGDLAGWKGLSPNGYRQHQIMVKGKKYRAGRIAWYLHTGSWPLGEIDHIDCDPWNQRWVNLRDVPHSVNTKNLPMSSRNTSGCTGVSQRSWGKWRASIYVGKKHLHLGTYDTFDEAVLARQQAEIEYGFLGNNAKTRNKIYKQNS